MELYSVAGEAGPSKQAPFARLSAESCEGSIQSQQKWKFNFDSVFGKHSLDLTIDLGGGDTVAVVDGTRFIVNNLLPLPSDQVSEICKGLVRDPSAHVKDVPNSFVAFSGRLLNHISPKCDFRWESRWRCDLEKAKPRQVIERIGNIKRWMIIRHKRNPYQIIRRLAVTAQLARVLENIEEQDGKDNFCTLIKHAEGVELPRVMVGRWRQMFCENDSTDKTELAAVGLKMALDELEVFKFLLDKSTTLGLLKVDVDSEPLLTPYLWVRVLPTQPTTGPILKELEYQPNGFCFHPAFSTRNYELAGLLGLLGGNEADSCIHDEKREDGLAEKSLNYLTKSLMSEGSFLISNGHAKMLRLPPGQYEYEVYSLPENPKLWYTEDNLKIAKGRFVWTKKRPRPLISKANFKQIEHLN